MTWTNASLRKHLGERGFLASGETMKSGGRYYTNFVRGADELVLVEYMSMAEPEVFQDGKPVEATDIGYRNEQIQEQARKPDA